MPEKEYSESGDEVHRYKNVEPNPFTPAFGDLDNIETIGKHIEKHIGKIETVYHEIVSDQVHLDVYWVKPSKKFRFNVLVTSGMSDKPMTVPTGMEEYRFSELCILLPPDWPIDEESFKSENYYWPVRWLKIVARFPHEFNAWVGYGHTIPNGEGAEPFADNTKFGCVLLIPSLNLPHEFFRLKVKEDKVINFYCIYPLYKEEMEYKLSKGLDALIDKFEKSRVTDVVDIHRKNTCLSKGLFGLW